MLFFSFLAAGGVFLLLAFTIFLPGRCAVWNVFGTGQRWCPCEQGIPSRNNGSYFQQQ